MDTLLTPTVDIRPADQRFKTNIGWLDSKHSFSFGHHHDRTTPITACCWSTTTTSCDAGHRIRDPPAPRHGDRHLGAAGLAGAPGLHRPLRRDLSGARAADERRHRHPALGEERLLAAVRATRHTDPVHFVQMWVVPDEPASPPATSSWRSTTSCSPAGSSRSRPGWPSTTAPPRSGSRTSTPPCYAARLRPARA